MGGTDSVTQRVESLLNDPGNIDADDAGFMKAVIDSLNNEPDYIKNNLDTARAKQRNDLRSLLSSEAGTAAYTKACELKGFELAGQEEIGSDNALILYNIDEFLTPDSKRKQAAIDAYEKTHPGAGIERTITVGETEYEYDAITGLIDDNGEDGIESFNNIISMAMSRKSLGMELSQIDKENIQLLRDKGLGEIADLIDGKQQGEYAEATDSVKRQIEGEFIELAKQGKKWEDKYEISSVIDSEVRENSDFDAVIADIPDVVGNWNPYFRPSPDDMYGAIRTGYDISQMPTEVDEGTLKLLYQGLKGGTLTQAKYDELKKQFEDNIKSTESLREAWSGYGFITKDIFDTFTYLYKKGKETGDYTELYKYFDIFESELTDAQYRAYHGRMEELVNEEGPWGEILSGVAATGGAFAAPMAYIETGIEALTGQEGSTTSMNQLLARSANDFNELAASTSEGFGKFLIEAGLSLAQNLPSYALGPAGAFYSAAQAAGMDAAQQKLYGATPLEAFRHATVIGTIEYIFEKLPLDRLKDMIKGIPLKGFAKTVISLAGNAGIEFTQESLTCALQNLMDTMIAGDRSQYSQLVKQNLRKGMTEEEANSGALYTLFFEQPVKEGAIGAFTGEFADRIETAAGRAKADAANFKNSLIAINKALGSGKMTARERAALKQIQAEAKQGLAEAEAKAKLRMPEGDTVTLSGEDGSDIITRTEIGKQNTTEAENAINEAIKALDKLGIDTGDANEANYDYLTASAEGKADAFIRNADTTLNSIDAAIKSQKSKGLDTSSLESMKARLGQIKQSVINEADTGVTADAGAHPSKEKAMADGVSLLMKLPPGLQAKVKAETTRQAFYDSLTAGGKSKTAAHKAAVKQLIESIDAALASGKLSSAQTVSLLKIKAVIEGDIGARATDIGKSATDIGANATDIGKAAEANIDS